MNAVELSNLIKKRAQKISEVANSADYFTVLEIGFAIPIPDDAEEAVKVEVDREFANLEWRFLRVKMGERDYYVLFLL